jgi:hypothetical protein
VIRQDALELVELLVAAFPYPEPPEATLLLYLEELERLESAETAREAIEELYRAPETRYLPSIGQIHETYWRCQRDAAERQERGMSARGLPAGEYQPPPREVVERFAELGIDLSALLKPIPDAGAPPPAEGGS